MIFKTPDSREIYLDSARPKLNDNKLILSWYLIKHKNESYYKIKDSSWI